MWIRWSFLFWVCLGLGVINLPSIVHERDLAQISSRASILAFLAFLTALFAPITEFGKVFRWRPVFVGLIAAFLGALVAPSVISVEPTHSFWDVILIYAFLGYFLGLLLGVPSVILGITKRDLQAYFNRFMTVVILLGVSLSAIALSWAIFAYPFLLKQYGQS
ncbi:hypothetical protein [Halotia branconii]|uniref:Uncharacterized protein n=1 Tax=Halotia branconii CENA392 TaxID=1539056 RepID=A0AAJ6P9S2_9CYAN|nr:hypothetical protein [Halotia branconii]WGV26129.1 hypothetical protein QI031_01010 [Halotia branconii CENA392]